MQRMRERLVKLAGPASSRENRGAQRGHVQSSFTQNSALQGINVFDYENLRRLMSQIQPDNGQTSGNRRQIEKSIHAPRRAVVEANQQQPLIREPI